MQRVIHQYINKSPVFMMIEELYSYVSDYDEHFDDIIWLDKTFKDLCTILQENLYDFNSPKIKYFNLPKISYDWKEKKEVIVCLSGGKDSAAVAYCYKMRGYKVHLYHATGVNKAYGDEKLAAQKIADFLGCELFIDKIQLAGTHKFIEHPLKNYIIANGALHYAMGKGYRPFLAFGNFNQAKLADNPFDVCAGDCMEMWDAYTKIIHKVLPEFKIRFPLRTNADTYEILVKDWKLFGMCVSCMSPFRFREHWKHRTEQRYNVKLFDNRCGCCWKDCVESIWLMDHHKVDFNKDFYRHCYKILYDTIQKETGTAAESVYNVWENYMFYPIEKSRDYKWLMQIEKERNGKPNAVI